MFNLNTQPWIISAKNDLIFILSPPFLALLLVFVFPDFFANTHQMPEYYWLIMVVFIDVAHVYSTLFRTYFHRSNFIHSGRILILIPLACYILGVIIHSIDSMLFWRILAYTAVFHFVRQQFGIMKLYNRNESQNSFFSLIDSIAIYTATLYPLFFWHLSDDRSFAWFMENDFLIFPSNCLIEPLTFIYIFILLTYFLKEIIYVIKFNKLNIARNILILGTFLSWYFGIVYFNVDMVFTTLNVISHGIPYIALIWFLEKKKTEKPLAENWTKWVFNKYGFILFLLPLLIFAYLEEGLWNSFIWREHNEIFSFFKVLPQISDPNLLSFLVPLLALPQATHYVLDGFIWKKNSQF